MKKLLFPILIIFAIGVLFSFSAQEVWATTCLRATPHYSSGCQLLLHYDVNNDGKIDVSENLTAINNYFDGLITQTEMLFVIDCYIADGVNISCPGCYTPPCKSHYTYSCYANDVYWYDSCQNREEKKQECYSGYYTANYQCSGTWLQRQYRYRGCSGSSCYDYYGWLNYTDCGTDYCEAWGSNYCKDNDVYHKRTCHSKGCSRNACYDTTYIQEIKVQECGESSWTTTYQCSADGRYLQRQYHYKGCSGTSCYDYYGWVNWEDCAATGKICQNEACVTPVTCWGTTPHYSSGCQLLLHYDTNNDGKIDVSENLTAINNYFDGLITITEMLFVADCYIADGVNISCPGCYDAIPPTAWVSGAPTNWQKTDAAASVGCSDTDSGCNSSSYRLKTYTSSGSCSTNYSEYTLISPQTISSYLWVCAAAKDNVGNVGFSPTRVEFKVDKEKPVSEITSPPTDSTHTADFLVSVSDTDTGGSGLDLCYYRTYDSGQGYTRNWTTRACNSTQLLTVGSGKDCPTIGGTCRVFVFATDKTGNSGDINMRSFKIGKKVTCWETTPHYSSGCQLLLNYDVNDDGVIDISENLTAINNYFDGLITQTEMLFVIGCYTAGEINKVCPDCSVTYTLTVSKIGSGTVTDTGINCGTDCSQSYPAGTTVTLTAIPDSDWDFAFWLGDCSGTGTCTLTMNSDKSVIAAFGEKVTAAMAAACTPDSPECQLLLHYDTDDNGKIEIGELLTAINDYIAGKIIIGELLPVINCYMAEGINDVCSNCYVVTLDYCSSCSQLADSQGIVEIRLHTGYQESDRTPCTDYTESVFTTLVAGNSYILEVTVQTSDPSTEYVKAWIDFNQDKDFFDPGEEIDLGVRKFFDHWTYYTFKKEFTVPSDAALGETRMRIIEYCPNPVADDPCANNFYGETEDYKINLIPAAAVPPNIALEATASHSGGGAEGWGPQQLNNNDTAGVYPYCETEAGGWVQLEWTSPVTIDYMKVWYSRYYGLTYESCLQGCRVEWWDGSSWQEDQFYSYPEYNTVHDNMITLTQPRTTTKVRLSDLNGSWKDNVMIQEWQVFSPPVSAPTVTTDIATVNLQNETATLRGSVSDDTNVTQIGFEWWGKGSGSWTGAYTGDFSHPITINSSETVGDTYYYRAKAYVLGSWIFADDQRQVVIYEDFGGQQQFTTPTAEEPTIAFNPSEFSFYATQGGANPPTQTLEIWNSGKGTLNWSVSDNAAWLSLSPTSGSSTGEQDKVTLSVNISGMTAGNYNATITITDPNATNSPQTVPVSLSITAPPPPPPPPPPPAPTVDIKANGSNGPITIDYNTSATLTWVSTNATSCTASGDWSGSKPTSGSEQTGNLTSSKTYALTCTGTGGSAYDSVTVNVTTDTTPPTPNIRIFDSANNDVTEAKEWLKADTYTIKFKAIDNELGLDYYEYYIYSCAVGGTSCNTKIDYVKESYDGQVGIEVIKTHSMDAGKSPKKYNLEGAGRYKILFLPTDKAGNTESDPEKNSRYVNFDFTPPETWIE